MRRLVVPLLLLALAFGLPATASAGTAQSRMLHAINSARAAAGAPAVKPYRPLMRSSRRYARYMVTHDRWAHAANPASGCHISEVGEILGMSDTPSPASDLVVKAWLASPEHRPILLDPHFRYVGIGLRHGDMAGQQQWVWVVRFGRK